MTHLYTSQSEPKTPKLHPSVISLALHAPLGCTTSLKQSSPETDKPTKLFHSCVIPSHHGFTTLNRVCTSIAFSDASASNETSNYTFTHHVLFRVLPPSLITVSKLCRDTLSEYLSAPSVPKHKCI